MDEPRDNRAPLAVTGGPASQGIEMALVIAILFGLGYVLDAWLDTRPVFMIALSVFAMVGVSIRYWLAYNRRMDAAEEERRKAVYG